MNTDEKNGFGVLMWSIAELYGKKLSPELLEIYWRIILNKIYINLYNYNEFKDIYRNLNNNKTQYINSNVLLLSQLFMSDKREVQKLNSS
jgi:hypothetical protein